MILLRGTLMDHESFAVDQGSSPIGGQGIGSTDDGGFANGKPQRSGDERVIY